MLPNSSKATPSDAGKSSILATGTMPSKPAVKSKILPYLPLGDLITAIPGQLAEVSTVFALGTSHGSISLADELMSSLSHQMNTEPVYFTKAAKQCANPQKVSNYFEIHYKHAYCIRSSQSLKQEYLRLPQSSIHKDD